MLERSVREALGGRVRGGVGCCCLLSCLIIIARYKSSFFPSVYHRALDPIQSSCSLLWSDHYASLSRVNRSSLQVVVVWVKDLPLTWSCGSEASVCDFLLAESRNFTKIRKTAVFQNVFFSWLCWKCFSWGFLPWLFSSILPYVKKKKKKGKQCDPPVLLSFNVAVLFLTHGLLSH